ncbi:uncharacterized protein BCR38DRAFT_461241 [Pseudomassariella vexata]|uniref:Uncharacterized protein n=1 Tax=Pseudomassariella vexata TaxID=1141098 RepID=A0A1Y2DE04_9PEZI|nr:uncharacterized protein BCR38DRAFT_461241 [Pseudomassariella vexata]ORY57523.1 hypothetical protein BCR38DRAFT_461241 [Pseudomassariella vexata]
MALRTAHKAPAHGKSGSTGSLSGVLYPHPASPTLTNPDMILPDYDDGISSPDRSQSPLMMWKNAHSADMRQFDLGGQPFPSGPITPATPIIYGNGTMLSDIGEVTEAESVRPMKMRDAARNGYTHHEVDMRASPNALPYHTIKRQASRDLERRMSMESTSTITNGDQSELFADFDDAVSVEDSNFEGDDEESTAQSYVYDDASVASAQYERIQTPQEIRKDFVPSEEDRYSTALSRRAEQILANAKRRLTTMEGNLSRARSSISSGSGSTPSPTIGRPATAIHRDRDVDFAKPHMHTRVSSENNIPIDIKQDAAFSQRASSALGAAGGYRQPLQNSRSADYIRDGPRSTNYKSNSIYGNAAFAKSKPSLHESIHTLEPLSEDEVPPGLDSFRPSLEDTRHDSFLSPTFGSYGEKGLKRSASTAQMRDLKDQMNDLKGRLSTLRDQARADSMKRRSMSNLRTASPFTHAHAETWRAETSNSSENISPKGGSSSWSGKELSIDERSNGSEGNRRMRESLGTESMLSTGYAEPEEYSPRTKLTPPESSSHSPTKSTTTGGLPVNVEEDDDDMMTEDGFQDVEDEGLDRYSDSGESSYHDSVQNQLSHEDREDAFDYEHFFLHSAMGTLSQKRMRRRSQDSFSSEESIETTRGPITSTDVPGFKSNGRGRRGSNTSTSTMDSFATATEGRSTRADDPDNEAVETPEILSLETVPEQVVETSEWSQSSSPPTDKRATFGFAEDNTDGAADLGQHRTSVIYRPQSSAAVFVHRPSVSSLESTGTARSFPLVNPPKPNGIMTPPGTSPEESLKQISETIMSETASICESVHGDKAPINMLATEDQILVERLVASLGRCVLGLTESGRASIESRMYKRRIDSARRILEGLDQPA